MKFAACAVLLALLGLETSLATVLLLAITLGLMMTFGLAANTGGLRLKDGAVLVKTWGCFGAEPGAFFATDLATTWELFVI